MGLFGGHPLEAETGFGWVPPESREEVPPESREEESRNEETAIEGRDKKDNNRVHAARLYDKLDQLERKWLSQKTQKRVKGPNKRARASSSSRSFKATIETSQPVSYKGQGREQPVPDLTLSHCSTDVTIESDKQPLTPPASCVSPTSAESHNQVETTKGTPRTVSMFDRLYQKGKAKSITPKRMMEPQNVHKTSRSRKRQRAATLIQSCFRGSKVRRRLHQQTAATVIQSCFRGNKVRIRIHQQTATTIKLQSWWRGIWYCFYFQALKESVVLVQSLERRRVSRRARKERRNAVLLLQGQWRVCVAKRLRNQLARSLERQICKSHASALIQNLLVKHLTKLRQQHVECESLITGESPSDEMDENEEDEEEEEEEEENCLSEDESIAGPQPLGAAMPGRECGAVKGYSAVVELETKHATSVSSSGESSFQSDETSAAECHLSPLIDEFDEVLDESPVVYPAVAAAPAGENYSEISNRPETCNSALQTGREDFNQQVGLEKAWNHEIVNLRLNAVTEQEEATAIDCDVSKDLDLKLLVKESQEPVPPLKQEEKGPSPPVSFYRAAQVRRRALKQASHIDAKNTSRSPSSSSLTRKPCSTLKTFSRSIVYDYLPTKKKYWHYDAQKLALVPTIQRWAKDCLRMKRLAQSATKIQSIWRRYRAHSLLISSCLLKEWYVSSCSN